MKSGTHIVKTSITALVLGIALPSITYADAGLPMLALVWPASWLLFVPIVAVEVWFALRLRILSFRSAVKSTAMANAASTLVGIPVTWFVLVLVEMVATHGGRAYGLSTFGKKVLAVTLQAPWLIPYESDLDWMVPAAGITLLGPFFLVSVLAERWVFQRAADCSLEAAASWSWRANAVSYGCIFLIVAGLLAQGIRRHL